MRCRDVFFLCHEPHPFHLSVVDRRLSADLYRGLNSSSDLSASNCIAAASRKSDGQQTLIANES
jgi:hypothetical protein